MLYARPALGGPDGEVITSLLTDVSDFSKYFPEGCSGNLVIPMDVVAGNKNRVEAHLVLACEQSGGTTHMDCKVKTVR